VALAEVRPKTPPVTSSRDDRGLGALLRQARERLGLSLDQVARDTKIPKRLLEALERDNLTVAPGGIYLRAEVRAYARAVHIDEALALSQLQHALNPLALPGEQTPAAHPPDADAAIVLRPRVRPWLVLSAVVIAVAIATWFWRSTTTRGDDDARESAALYDPARATGSASNASPTSLVSDDAARDGSRAESSGQTAPPLIQPTTASSPPADTLATGVTRQPPQKVEPLRPAEGRKPAAPKGLSTELVVLTSPDGARVTVDGISGGTSPVTIRHVAPGPKRIRVTLDGYVSEERSATLVLGHPQRIEVQLRER